MLIQASLINFRKKEVLLDIKIIQGSIFIDKSYTIIVYNNKDKIKIG